MIDNRFNSAAEAGPDASLFEFGFDGEGDRWLDHLREAEGQAPLGSIGRYIVLEEISRGGQGIVYRARDPDTNRHVAIKRLVAGTLATSSMRRRFEREVEAAASLCHPNIVTVFGTELVGGQPVLIMEWIDGVPITEWRTPAGAEPTTREALQVFVRVCEAVHHAHRRGVIHRDLKPSNILIAAPGVPHVVDFGIAKLTTPDGQDRSSVTLSGQFVGTPAYASPEHVRGRENDVDVRSDVYSLGVILYEMLCGRLPYPVEGSLADIFDSIERAEPAAISGALGREVQAILLKALRKDPEERYASVEAMGQDVTRLLRGEPVEARGRSAWYLARKCVQRHRIAVLVGTLVLVVAFGYMVLMPVLVVHARREADRTRQVQTFLQETMATASPFRLGLDPHFEGMLGRAVERVDSASDMEPGVEAAIRLTIAQAYGSLWAWSASQRQAALAERILRRFPAKAEELGVCLNLRGRALAFMNDTRSVTVLEETLQLRRRLYGASHPLVAETLTSIGFAHWRAFGQSRRACALAEVHYRDALAMHRRTQDRVGPIWARSLYSAGMFFQNQRRFDEAEPLLVEAVGAYRAMKDETFYTIMCLRGYGALLRNLERLDEAEAIFREAESLYPQGVADGELAQLKWDLGCLALCRGARGEADRRFRDALAIVCSRLADRYPAKASDLRATARQLRAESHPRPYEDVDELLDGLDDGIADHWLVRLRKLEGP